MAVAQLPAGGQAHQLRHSLMLALLNGGPEFEPFPQSFMPRHSLMLALLNGGLRVPCVLLSVISRHSLMLALLNGGNDSPFSSSNLTPGTL